MTPAKEIMVTVRTPHTAFAILINVLRGFDTETKRDWVKHAHSFPVAGEWGHTRMKEAARKKHARTIGRIDWSVRLRASHNTTFT